MAIGLVIVQWRLPSAAIIELPKGHSSPARWAALLEVLLFGSVSALVTAIPAMAVVPTVSSPFNFPLFQGLLKIVVGGLTALVVVIVIGGNGVTQGFASFQSLVGTAIIFGAGQQAITQFLDKRAGQIVASAGK